MKKLSIFSWNVEHFKDKTDWARTNRIIEEIKKKDPDVISLQEVEGKDIFWEVTLELPNYSWQITEGRQVQEIAIGVKHGITSFYTQKNEYKSGVTTLRPSPLLTITNERGMYALLFMHAKSGTDPRSFGLRDDMINKSLKFSSVLRKAVGSDEINYVVLGDLNVMGMNIVSSDKDISGEEELNRIGERGNRYYDMRRLPKTYENTWLGRVNGEDVESGLDQVFASNNLKFKKFQKHNGGEVEVGGWCDFETREQKENWVKEYSDHCFVYLEII